MTAEEATIALLAIQQELANCAPSYIIRNTLRYKAMQLAARFVDPSWAHEQSEDEADPIFRFTPKGA